MLNFNGNFVVDTEVAYVGMGLPVFSVDAEVDQARSYGSAVKLEKGNAASKYPFGLTMKDAANGDTFGGVIMMGVNYDESGKPVVGKTERVMTKGTVCVKVDASLKNAQPGDKVYWNAGSFNATATGAQVGIVASNVFKAKTLESSATVDAAYIYIGF